MIKEILITLLSLTGTTEYASNWLGVRPFLPFLMALRFSTLSLMEQKDFIPLLNACTSFKDDKWTAYWNQFALKHLSNIEARVGENLEGLLECGQAPPQLNSLLAGGIALITSSPPGKPVNVELLVSENPTKAEEIRTLDDAIKAITFLFLASWPGESALKIEYYHKSNALFDIVLKAVADPLGLVAARDTLNVEGEKIRIYSILPKESEGPLGAVLIATGLEGTNQENILPGIHLKSKLAQFYVEMPGTYGFKKPVHPEGSIRIYKAIIDHISKQPRVDPNRIGMIGLSFGAHWSTRMAIKEPRLKCVVSNGGLYSHSFSPSGSIGKPEVITKILKKVTGSKSMVDMKNNFHALILTSEDLKSIKCPILAINGDKDTLCSTQDTVDLGTKAPLGELVLYENDDHCAMNHLTEWLVYSNQWMEEKLGA